MHERRECYGAKVDASVAFKMRLRFWLRDVHGSPDLLTRSKIDS